MHRALKRGTLLLRTVSNPRPPGPPANRGGARAPEPRLAGPPTVPSHGRGCRRDLARYAEQQPLPGAHLPGLLEDRPERLVPKRGHQRRLRGAVLAPTGGEPPRRREPHRPRYGLQLGKPGVPYAPLLQVGDVADLAINSPAYAGRQSGGNGETGKRQATSETTRRWSIEGVAWTLGGAESFVRPCNTGPTSDTRRPSWVFHALG